MSRLNEQSIEEFAIELLEKLGYDYIYGPQISPDGESSERSSYEQILLMDRLTSAARRINKSLPASAVDDALREIQRLSSPDLLSNNEAFHKLLTEGIPVILQKDGDERGDRVWLIDFNNPANNEFLAVNQYTITENHYTKRPDLIIFINGIPIVVLELKNPADENATLHSAFMQFDTYKALIPSLFTYNGFVIISDGLEAKAGTISANFSRFMAWKSTDGKAEASHLISGLETLIKGMLNKDTLLDLLKHFIVFEKSKNEDTETNIITIKTVKKMAAYHQYYAVNRAVESTLRAAGFERNRNISANLTAKLDDKRLLLSADSQSIGDRKGGVVWHTQGSGKSLSMVFYTGKIVLAMDNPTVVVITDRNDLDDQLFDTFAASKQLLRQEPVQADNRDKLKE